MKAPADDDPIRAVAALAEPTRRSLYDLVAASPTPVGRDDAAGALGIGRELAAFHLDRLVEAGLLRTEFRRRSGRTGPGAGRPAKLYRRVDGEVVVSLPTRHYERAADLMAAALAALPEAAGVAALARVARDHGVQAGRDARHRAGGRPATRPPLDGLVAALDEAGYEPRREDPGTVCLRNCPYRLLATDHRDLTCGMNLAWAEGLVGGLGTEGVTAVLAPEPGRCCVVFRADPGTAGAAGSDVTAPSDGG